MSKIGFVTALNRADSKLSVHFGLAKWVAVMDSETRHFEFIRNADLTGRSVVEILKREGCDEVVFRNIGAGALRQVKAVNIAPWHAIEDKTVPELYADLLQGRLRLARRSTEGSGQRRRSAQKQQSKEK